MDWDEATQYRVKRVVHKGRWVPIIMQNKNGPCPLLAICNVLLLRGNLAIHPDYAVVSFDHLSNIVSDYLVESNMVNHPGTQMSDVEFNVNDVISLMPTLQYGLDVNIKFANTHDFEFTKNLLLFDLLHMRLLHGWLVDPNDTESFAVINKLSYNQLAEGVIAMREVEERRELRKKRQQTLAQKQLNQQQGQTQPPGHDDNPPPPQQEQHTTEKDDLVQLKKTDGSETGSTSEMAASEKEEPQQEQQTTTTTQNAVTTTTTTQPSKNEPQEEEKEIPEETTEEKKNNDDIVRKGLIIEGFLHQSAGQLTYVGLHKLHEDIRDGELLVFFRNNHFATMTKHKGELFTLVTDVGYHEEHVVWEKVCEIDGDSVFVNSDFVIPPPPPPPQPQQQPAAAGDTDDLVQSLSNMSHLSAQEQQEEMDRMVALQLMEEEEVMASHQQQQHQQARQAPQGQMQPAAPLPPATHQQQPRPPNVAAHHSPPRPTQQQPQQLDLDGLAITDAERREQQAIYDQIQQTNASFGQQQQQSQPNRVPSPQQPKRPHPAPSSNNRVPSPQQQHQQSTAASRKPSQHKPPPHNGAVSNPTSRRCLPAKGKDNKSCCIM